jgi:hypothetical protein
VGAIFAVERAPQLWLALLVFVGSLAWDQMFLIYDTLPATIPPAVVLVGYEGWRRVRQGGRAGATDLRLAR